MAINIKKVNEKTQELIIEKYKQGVSMRQLEKDFNVTRQSIAKFLTEIGVKTTIGNHYRTYYHNFNFFEEIDSEKKAYWLGFIFADGFIGSKRKHGDQNLGITISQNDIGHLEKFKIDIEATNPINTYKRKNNSSTPTVRLMLTSQKTVDDLKEKGCIENKSLILQPPKGIPKKYIRHFIRGFFDGDGSISVQPNKNRYSVSICSTLDMLEWIQKHFFNMGSIIKEKRRGYSYYLNIGGRLQALKIKEYLYNNSTVFLQRKFDVFSQIPNTSKDGV